MSNIQTFSAPVGRVLIATLFVMAGMHKIFEYAGTQGYMEAMGVPGALLPLVILLEAVGGLAIIVGWKTRPVAFALAGFSILSAILFHANFADQNTMNMFMKNITIAGGFLFLVAHGPGAYALDNRASNKASDESVGQEEAA
ncbi:MAG: DoxX family protein [Rhodospirillales bacterium]|nr:DoxX family protein [Rhodospirillales bacterium]